jgi:hypothetical protein
MHDRGDVASDGFAANFRRAEQAGRFPVRKDMSLSKDCQMKRSASDHDARVSNESRDP